MSLTDNNFQRNSRMLLSPFISYETDEQDIDNIMNDMKETKKHPNLRKVSRNDLLIRELCKGLLHKLGTPQEQRRKDKNNVRTKVRAVTRLLVQLNQETKQNVDLQTYISPKYFPMVVKTVKKMGLSSPQLALTMGHYLKCLSQLKKSLAMRNQDTILKTEAEEFDIDYNAHWNNYVSAAALRRQKLLSLNKPIELPLTSDLVALKEFLDERIDAFLSKEKPTFHQRTAAAQALLVRLIILNKRRIAEVEELKITDVTQSQRSEDQDDVMNHLNISEQTLAKRMSVIEVRGKSTRGLRKVFVLLTEKMKEACLHLIDTRLRAGIPSDNPFLFSNSEKGPIDGCKAMRNMSDACPNLKKPHVIRSRLLRRYLATTAQVLEMTGDELQMVADHMGHSVSIHTYIYRTQSSLLERTKVARALIAIESGKMTKFAGRNLTTVPLDEIPVVVADEDEVTKDNSAAEISKEASAPDDEIIVCNQTQLKRKRNTYEYDDEVPDDVVHDNQTQEKGQKDDDFEVVPPTKTKKNSQKIDKRRGRGFVKSF